MKPVDEFLHAHTQVAHHPFVPEIALHIAREVVPIWQAMEVWQGSNNLPPPYWAFCWPGGAALTRYVLDHPDVVRGKRVLDFAAGCGVTAIAAAMNGAMATAADIDLVAAQVIPRNATLNNVNVAVVTLDVTEGADDGWDVVLAGDVCYERPMAGQVFGWLRRNAAAGATVLMADPGRDYLPKEGLERVAQYTVPTTMDLEKDPSRSTTVYRVLP